MTSRKLLFSLSAIYVLFANIFTWYLPEVDGATWFMSLVLSVIVLFMLGRFARFGQTDNANPTVLFYFSLLLAGSAIWNAAYLSQHQGFDVSYSQLHVTHSTMPAHSKRTSGKYGRDYFPLIDETGKERLLHCQPLTSYDDCHLAYSFAGQAVTVRYHQDLVYEMQVGDQHIYDYAKQKIRFAQILEKEKRQANHTLFWCLLLYCVPYWLLCWRWRYWWANAPVWDREAEFAKQRGILQTQSPTLMTVLPFTLNTLIFIILLALLVNWLWQMGTAMQVMASGVAVCFVPMFWKRGKRILRLWRWYHAHQNMIALPRTSLPRYDMTFDSWQRRSRYSWFTLCECLLVLTLFASLISWWWLLGVVLMGAICFGTWQYVRRSPSVRYSASDDVFICRDEQQQEHLYPASQFQGVAVRVFPDNSLHIMLISKELVDIDDICVDKMPQAVFNQSWFLQRLQQDVAMASGLPILK